MASESGNVSPGDAKCGSSRTLVGYAEQRSDALVRHARGSQLPDSPDLVGSELGMTVGLAATDVAATLSGHVVEVVSLSANGKMCGVDARRVVATVENAQSFWDRTIRKGPAYSAAYSAVVAIAPPSEYPISCAVPCGEPRPTLADFANGYAPPKPALVFNIVIPLGDHAPSMTCGTCNGQN